MSKAFRKILMMATIEGVALASVKLATGLLMHC